MFVRFLATIAGLLPCICTAEVSFVCPEAVHLASASLTADSIPPGFSTATSTAPIRLSGINMFDGPPEQGAALIPFQEEHSAKKKVTVSSWKFDSSYPQGKFASCDYANGILRVVIRTDDTVKSCVAKTEIVKPYGTIKASFNCQ